MKLLADKARVVEALVGPSDAFAPEVARAGLEAEVAAWSDEGVANLLAALPAGWQARAPGVVLVLAARTLPASAVRQCLFARALGARVHLKMAAGQEAIGEALAAIDDGIVPTPFSSDDEAAVRAAIAKADSIVVLGSDATVRAVRALVPPDKGFAAHGHKVSAAWVSDGADVDGLAVDVLAWDQAGCLAPQVIWVEGDADALADRLAVALRAREHDLPLRDPGEQRAARQRLIAMTAMLGGRLMTTASAAVATVPDGAFRPSPAPRVVWVVPADGAALGAIAPALSTLATDRAAPIPLAASTRVCRPGEMQRPPLDWAQDGLHPLASLLRPQ